jgi:DNA-binding IclR family transcriptional regulator
MAVLRKMIEAPRTKTRTSVVVAAFEVLEAFKCPSELLTLAEVARKVRASKPTVMRILRKLSDLGYIKRDVHSGKYYLGLKILEYARYVRPADCFRTYARPYMRQLLGQFDLMVNLAIKDGDTITYVDTILPASDAHLEPTVGSSVPIHSTALGKAIASFLPEAELLTILTKQGMPPDTSNTIVRVPAFLAEMERVRKQGYAEDNQEHKMGIICLAAAIRNATGRSVGAISITGPPSRFQGGRKKEIGEYIRSVAHDFSLRAAGDIVLARLAP